VLSYMYNISSYMYNKLTILGGLSDLDGVCVVDFQILCYHFCHLLAGWGLGFGVWGLDLGVTG